MTPPKSSIQYVRANRRVFLGPSEKADLRDFAGMLVVDALCLNCAPIGVDRIDDWHVVYCEQDWIRAESKLSALEAFQRTQIFHEHHPNSNRASVIVTAFSKELFTVGDEGITMVKGEPAAMLDLAQSLQARFPKMRVVAFRGLDE